MNQRSPVFEVGRQRHRIQAPKTIEELVTRAEGLAGRTLASLAGDLDLAVPSHSTSAKGWAGQLIEALLGSTAASKPEPDFPHLGVELKTIPVGPAGVPRESTHVCVAPLVVEPEITWQTSLVRRKLARVLWMPILWPVNASVGQRILCSPFLWTLEEPEETELRSDWEELIELIALGRGHEITAHHGNVLQLRPKAPNARTTVWTTGPDGQRMPANPRGFYLRTSFTRRLLDAYFNS